MQPPPTFVEIMSKIDQSLPRWSRELRFALLREERNQRWLARRLGVNHATVGEWVRGKSRPGRTLREAIETLLGVSVDVWEAS